MAELSENQRKKIVRLGQLETFAEIVDSLYGSPMGASGSDHAPGQVPDPGATAGTSKYLREDGTWATPPNIEYNEATTSTAGLLSAADKTKLNGIEANADVTDAENVKLALDTNSNHGGEFLRKDGTWQVPTLSNSDVGLGNVLNKEQIPVEEKGVANGVATLDSMGKVPSIQLPSYVDDVIELLTITDTAPLTCVKDDKYYNTSSNKIFIATAVNTWDTTGETPEKEKIYVNTSNEKSYRWGGSAMIAVGSSDIEGIKVGSSGSLITPSQGIITIPAYETGADVTDAENVKAALGTDSTHGDTFLRKDGTWVDPLPSDVAYLDSADGSAYSADFDPETDTVWNKQQTLTAAQKAQARTNIGALSSDDIAPLESKVTIQSASGATLTAVVGKYYTMSNVGTLAITLPTIAAGTTTLQMVAFYISAGSSPAVTFTSTHSIYYSEGFEIAANTTYEVNAVYNGIAWVVTSVKIVIPSA